EVQEVAALAPAEIGNGLRRGQAVRARHRGRKRHGKHAAADAIAKPGRVSSDRHGEGHAVTETLEVADEAEQLRFETAESELLRDHEDVHRAIALRVRRRTQGGRFQEAAAGTACGCPSASARGSMCSRYRSTLA